jgi:heme/copper-type cytochrome/quinol oxidase subunit 4
MDIDNRLYDRTPGVEDHESTASVESYTAGLALAILLTIVSFLVSQTNLLWPPGVVPGLIVLALAQIGVHLVFFLHVSIGSDIIRTMFWYIGRLSRHRRRDRNHGRPQLHDAYVCEDVALTPLPPLAHSSSIGAELKRHDDSGDHDHARSLFPAAERA